MEEMGPATGEWGAGAPACWLTVGAKELNAAKADASPANVELIPKFTVGTTVTNCCQKFTRVKLAPKLIEWLPLTQFKLSVNCLTGVLRRCGPVVAVAFVTPAA